MPHIAFGTYQFLVTESDFFYEGYKSNRNSVVNKMLFLLVPLTILSRIALGQMHVNASRNTDNKGL